MPVNAVDVQPELAHKAGRAGAAILASRVVGLIREQAMATLFGAGMAADAFNVAFRIPNLLRDLFSEGAMPAVFVPIFTEYRKSGGEAAGWKLARQLMAALFVVAVGLCLLGYVLAPALVNALAPGFRAVPGKIDLAVMLMRVMLPFLPAVALAAVASGILNARGRFVIPALTPGSLNLGMLAAILLLVPVCETWGQPPILSMAIGVVLGGIAMFVFQLPLLHAEGFRMRIERPRRHPGVIRIGFLMLPAIVGLAATNINMFVSTFLASLLPQGSVSWLWFAYRVVLLPAGVFGAALATVSLTHLSRAVVDRDMDAMKNTLSATLRLMFALTVPASLWMAVMARPLVRLLYEHGQFGVFDSVQTANALQMYCIGLPAIAASGVFTRAFYSLGDTATPVKATLGAAGVGLALNLLFLGPLGFLGLRHVGLALATAVAAIVNLVTLVDYLRRRIGPIENRRTLQVAARSFLAGALVVLPSLAVLYLVGDVSRGWMIDLATTGSSLVVTLALGWWVMRLMKIEELPAIVTAVSSVLGRPGR